jgi:hypothetical protein
MAQKNGTGLWSIDRGIMENLPICVFVHERTT